MPRAEYGPIFEAAGKEWNVDPRLLRAIATQESGGNPRAVSRAGATGVMQIMPATGKELGVTDLTDPEQSIYAGAKYLSQMLDRYPRVELALAAYNAGPGRVDGYVQGRGGLPDETVKYVPAVTAHFQRISQPMADRRAPPAVMSDDEFLKAVGASDAAKPGAPMSDDEFLKAVGVGPSVASAPPAQTLDAPSTMDGMVNAPPPEQVAAAGGLDPVGSIKRIGSAVAQGAVEGAAKPPALITPTMQALGVYPPAEGGGTALQGINKLLIDPIAQLGEWAVRGLGGAFRGAQSGVAQTGAELGQPQLGRDLAAMPEAFMGGGVPAKGGPRANRLAPPNPADIANARIADDLVRRIETDVQGPARGKYLLDRITAEINRVDEAAKPPPAPVAAIPGEAGGFGRRSVGAAAASDQESNMPRAEMQAQRATAERDRLLEPQPRGVDTNEYIPGVQTTEAQMVQSARASRNEKRIELENSEPFKDLAKRNNEVRISFYDELAGTPTQKRRLEEARSQQAEADLRATWQNKQPADTTPVSDTAAAILTSPDGRRPAVRGVVDSVMKELTGPDGKPITDPEMLYGVRKHIDDLLSKEAAKDSPMAIRASAQLLELKGALDGVIEAAAPGFRNYLRNFADASRPIDEMTILQEFGPRLRDSQNRITYSSVQRMLKDIVDDRAARGVNPAQSISDEAMAKLFALRDDLRRVASADDLAKTAGSNTAQNTLDLIKNVTGKGIAEGAGIAMGGIPGVGSLLMQGVTGAMRANKLKRETDRAINPDRNRLSPPPN